jgi:putative transcriptional regulator
MPQTMRHFDGLCLTPIPDLAPDEIKAIRLKSQVSQSVFAHYLNVSPGIVSQWERGEKHPSGASLKLLVLVRNKGLEVIA